MVNDGLYDPASVVEVRFNAREIIIPLFRVVMTEYDTGVLAMMWERFKDWK